MHNTNQIFIPSYFHKGQTKAIIIGLIYDDSIEWLYFVRILNVDLRPYDYNNKNNNKKSTTTRTIEK